MTGTTILVVLTLAALVVAAPDARPVLLILAGVIVLTALLGVAVAFIKYKRVEGRVSKLPECFRAAYLGAHELLGTCELSGADRRGILTMILEIFEHAALDDRTVEDVTGGDLAAFVDRFASEAGRAHTLGYRISYASALFIAFLLFLKAYQVLRTGTVSLATLRSETLDAGIIVTYFIISYAFFPWLLSAIRKSAREQWSGARRLKILIPMAIPVGLMAALILIDDPAFRAVADRPIPIFTTLLSVALGVALLVGTILLTGFFRRK